MSTAVPDTIPALLEWRAARAAPEVPWLRFEDDTWTLPDVLSEVDRMAVGLAERGVVQGDCVAILLGNRPETLFTWFAANRLGAVAMPLNPAYKAPELAALLRLARPRVLVVGDELRGAILEEPAYPDAPVLRVVAPGDLTRSGTGSPRAPVNPEDVAVLIATSGTTGTPKAVMQTHRTYTLTAEAFPWWLGLTEADRLLCTLPLFHINAQAYSTMGALGCGAVLALTPRFSASRFWDEVRRHGATQVNAVGAMIHILSAAEPSAGDRQHTLRLCYSALALPRAQHRAFEDRFGVRMMVGYGLSETTFGTVWPLHGEPPYETMGVLRQHPRLGAINHGRVVRDDGAEAREGETGELWLANPGMLRGYLHAPDATRAAFEGHWFKTGDIVRREPGGCLSFVSRKKDVLRRRGENVAAVEIEAALLAHDDLMEAAVIGVPSAFGEDDIVAFVVPRPNAVIDPEVLRAFVRERLAEFKVPTRIHVRTSLPRTATERVAKHLLSET